MRAGRRAAGPGRAPRLRVPGHRPDARSPTACASSSRRCPGARSSRRRWRSAPAPADEPAELGGATVLAARGLTEGTEVRDADRADRGRRAPRRLDPRRGRLGRDVRRARRAGAAASRPRWSCSPRSSAGPRSRSAEVERLRDERLTDLLQAKADPRRRADEAYVSSIYAPSSPYHRPAGGAAETVEGARRPPSCARSTTARIDPAARRARRRRRRRPRRGRPRSPRRCSATGRGADRGDRPAAIDDTSRGRRPLRPRRPSPGRRPDRDPDRAPGPARAGTRTSTPCR